MKKFKNWLKRNKGLTIVFVLTLVLLIFISIIFIKLLMGGNGDRYGNRLDGIGNVRIDEDTYDNVVLKLKETKLVKDASCRLQGRIIYTTLILEKDTSQSTAKDLAKKTFENYTSDELKYYDFSFFLKWEGEEDDTVITGSKHHSLDDITWINS